jgi:hypothetical protein
MRPDRGERQTALLGRAEELAAGPGPGIGAARVRVADVGRKKFYIASCLKQRRSPIPRSEKTFFPKCEPPHTSLPIPERIYGARAERSPI